MFAFAMYKQWAVILLFFSLKKHTNVFFFLSNNILWPQYKVGGFFGQELLPVTYLVRSTYLGTHIKLGFFCDRMINDLNTK